VSLPAPDTIDADECAQLLRCTAGQVEEMARAGDIPGLKIGRGWLFVRADLLAFLAERARAEAADRRAKRCPSPKVQSIRSRRAPPALPVPLRATSAAPDPRP
jgi:excisionase family DNA binding protein